MEKMTVKDSRTYNNGASTPHTYDVCQGGLVVAECAGYNAKGNAEKIALMPELVEEFQDALVKLRYLQPEKFDDAAHFLLWEKSLARKQALIAAFEGE